MRPMSGRKGDASKPLRASRSRATRSASTSTLIGKQPYWFIAPFLVLFGAFFVYPLGFALYVSLTDWRGASGSFVGLDNFVRLFEDGAFHLALANNVWYSLSAVLLVIPLSLGLAVLLNQSWLRFRRTWRAIYFLPVATSTVVVAIVFLALYDSRYGTINYLLSLIGVDPISWLSEPQMVKPAVILLVAWRWTGLFMVYFLAGLQSIPKELHEAAQVDGAGPAKAFLFVTLPSLRPIVLFVLVAVTTDSLRIFDEPFILNRFSLGASGGPEDAGLSLSMYMYRIGFQYRDLGYASAIGIAIFALALILIGVQFWRLRDRG